MRSGSPFRHGASLLELLKLALRLFVRAEKKGDNRET
jgi:hypothetical protein